MQALPNELYDRCRDVLLQCGEFNSNASLRAVFVTAELRPFQFLNDWAVREFKRMAV